MEKGDIERIPSALIMAGGRGTRMMNPEKYLLRLGRETIVESLLEIAKLIASHVYVSTVEDRKTLMDICRSTGVTVIICKGDSFVSDLMSSLESIRDFPVIVLPGDIVVLGETIIPNFLKRARRSKRLLVNLSIDGVISGISFIKEKPVNLGELPYEDVNFAGGELVNVNTEEDYRRAISAYKPAAADKRSQLSL